MFSRNLRIILCLFVMQFASSIAHALGTPIIRLTANRSAVLNDGRDYAEIIAEPSDSSGTPFPDGTQVTFTSNMGVIQPGTEVRTQGGIARIRITSTQKGTAMIQAIVPAGGFAHINITFTDDPAETVQGNMYVTMQSKGSLIYSAGDRVIEAIGKPTKDTDTSIPNAILSFRNIEIFADNMQLDCSTSTVRTRGRTELKWGSHHLSCLRLVLPLMAGNGYALMDVDHHLKQVTFRPVDLQIENKPVTYPASFYEMKDLTNAKLIITASQIVLFPSQKLQFKHPHFYQDNQSLVSMAFYELPLYSNQLFTDQFVSVGSQGLSMDIPLYYDLSPETTGIFHIRHSEQLGRSVYATQPGWSLDLIQSYSSPGVSRRYSGQFGLTGITRTDWGASWSHSQEFDSNTRGTFFMDFAQHRTILGSTSIMHQLGMFYTGMTMSGTQTVQGIPSHGYDGQVYLETVPLKVAKTGYTMSVGGTTTDSHMQTANYISDGLTEDLHMRFMSNQFRMDRQTSLSNSFSVGNVWANGGTVRGGASILATLSLNRQLFKSSSIQLTYDYSRLPSEYTGGSHRLSANLSAGAGTKWSLYLYNTMMLDAQSSSTTADFNYTFASRWRITMSGTMQSFSGSQYRDYDIGIARSLLGKDLMISYSTYNHRVFFDLEASRF